MPNARRLGFLGILYQAHKALIGEDILRNIDKVQLLIVPAGEPSHQAKRLIAKAESRKKTVLYEDYSKEELGRALGHDEVSLLALLDKKSAESYLQK